MPTTATIKHLPAQHDEGILIAHPASVMSFLGVDVMVQRSVIDGKVLVTVDGDHRNTRIDMNDGTVYNGPGGETHLSDAERQAAEDWNNSPGEPAPSHWPTTDEEGARYRDWMLEVRNGNTALGFRDWVNAEEAGL
ncbi:hypothetical protein SEA_MUFASA8_62 [Arthrobacter phage Mufasa8]|uniref:Uncharacterized protein n=1 Tax=Arthrobacter phage Mufasa8 TaxID=2656526 RepID=A0A649VM59_9CAUD|nr:hypothetical protein HYQ08_gp062 [Arthrobacter phage Mufasa8]QGJ93510.1 hypothetical protein SEA_MUFASA8_62 [Arthrobacter phage Mufasa8]